MQASPAQLVAVARKLATCCRSRFGAAFGIVPRFCDHKAAATAGFAAGKTATGRAGEACISVISVKFSCALSSEQTQQYIRIINTTSTIYC